MAKHRKIKEYDWPEIRKKLLEGQTYRSVADDYGVTMAAIHKTMGNQVNQVRDAALSIVNAEYKLKQMPIDAEYDARALARELIAISDYLARSAKQGAMTSEKLSAIALLKSQGLDVDNLELEQLREIAALQDVANKSASTAIELLKITKGKEETMPERQEIVITGGIPAGVLPDSTVEVIS